MTDKCSKVVVIDANKLIASVLPKCKELVERMKKSSLTQIKLRNLLNYWQVCFFVPERILQIVPAKIKEKCLEIEKDVRKAEEFSEKTVNSLLEFLKEIEVVKVSEDEYRNYLLHPLAKLAKDVNDDNHLIATALYLKDKFGLQEIYILTNDNRLLEIKELPSAGIILTKREEDLEDWE